MLFPFSKKSDVSPLRPYIGAFVCVCFSGLFFYLALTQESPGQFFPFTLTAIAVSCFVWGILCVVQPAPKHQLRASEFHGNFVGIIVGLSVCTILGGILLDSRTQAIGWQNTPATVTGLPFIVTSNRHYRQQFTIQYQYRWQDTLFNGATMVTPSMRGSEPHITTSTRYHSIRSKLLVVGDQIQVKVNPERPDQSLYPQRPPLILYLVFLVFAAITWGCFRRLHTPPKLGEYK